MLGITIDCFGLYARALRTTFYVLRFTFYVSGNPLDIILSLPYNGWAVLPCYLRCYPKLTLYTPAQRGAAWDLSSSVRDVVFSRIWTARWSIYHADDRLAAKL